MHWCDKKPDVDNIAKSILDALNGTAYDDDKRVVALTIYKEYADIARVNVMLGELNDDGRREDSGDREGRA
jgi:Holliday junction resolvase RusA-like endonuclease